MKRVSGPDVKIQHPGPPVSVPDTFLVEPVHRELLHPKEMSWGGQVNLGAAWARREGVPGTRLTRSQVFHTCPPRLYPTCSPVTRRNGIFLEDPWVPGMACVPPSDLTIFVSQMKKKSSGAQQRAQGHRF